MIQIFSSRQLIIGPLTVSTHALLLLSAALTGSTVVFFMLKNDKIKRRLFFDILTGVILLVFAGWKVFPLFHSFRTLITHPLTLLYTPGGTGGIIFGIGTGFLYIIFKIFFSGKTANRQLFKPFLVFTGIFIVISSLLFGAAAVAQGKRTNRTAEYFRGKSIGGKFLSLENLRGKTIFLNFWATWCPPCKAEIPTLISFVNTLDNTSNTLIIGIDAATSEKSLHAIKQYMHTHGINYPVIPDSKGTIAASYNIRSLPTTLVISPDGIITGRHTGVVDYTWLRSHLPASNRLPEK